MKNAGYGLLIKIGSCILLAVLFKLIFFRLNEFLNWDILYISFIILLVWTGNLQIDQSLNNRYSWIDVPVKRLVLQITGSTLFTAAALFIFMNLIHQFQFGDGNLIDRKLTEIFFPALLLTFLILGIHVSSQFFRSMKHSLLEVEKYKTESANAQLQNLKNQLNPHFLFNNLSVLTTLVYKSQDKAIEFINELSKVYRYVLDNKSTELTTLSEELEFLAHYLYLLKIRFGSSIEFSIDIEESCKKNYLPPMCLQMLVENTIQHNEASQAKPLQVKIHTDKNTLVVENPVQPRTDAMDSSKTGLKNIRSRYAFFTGEKVEVIHTAATFKIVLPLINSK